MSVTAQQILDKSLKLYAQTKKDGTIDTTKTAEYSGKAIDLLNVVLLEIAEREGNKEIEDITALTDVVGISDFNAKISAVYGLIQLFAIADGDDNMFGFFSVKYENAKSKIIRKAFKIQDDMNILSGMR
jgi:hypothetical protein